MTQVIANDAALGHEHVGRVEGPEGQGERARDVLAEAIAEAKREARANGLMDEDIDAELEVWRGERKA